VELVAERLGLNLSVSLSVRGDLLVGARLRMWIVTARVVMVAGVRPAIPASATGENTVNRCTRIDFASPTQRAMVAPRL
jgi:hypothetical protein